MKCKKHPKYKAIRKPTAKCKECDCMYEETQLGKQKREYEETFSAFDAVKKEFGIESN